MRDTIMARRGGSQCGHGNSCIVGVKTTWRRYGWIVVLMIAATAGDIRAAGHTAPRAGKRFLTGADISDYGYIQAHGGIYRFQGKPVGLLQAFRLAGCNCLRLRLWHGASAAERARYSPPARLNNLHYTLPLARSVKKAGFYFVLDMHFSPTWADPGHQPMPSAWRHLNLNQLCQRLRRYTARVIGRLRKAGAMPDMVLAGNEINDGLLWPTGKLWVHHRARWNRVAKLLNAAIAGIDSASGGKRPAIMVQVGAFNYAPMFFRQLIHHGVHFNYIGYDFYPYWGGSLKHLKTSLMRLAPLGKPVIVAETAYPWINDRHNADWAKKPGMNFPFTPAGQAAYARKVIEIVKSLPHHLGQGVWWWGAEYNADQRAFKNNPWSYRSLFDAHGNALPAMRVLGRAAQ